MTSTHGAQLCSSGMTTHGYGSNAWNILHQMSLGRELACAEERSTRDGKSLSKMHGNTLASISALKKQLFGQFSISYLVDAVVIARIVTSVLNEMIYIYIFLY